MWEFILEKKRGMVYNFHMIIQPFWWAWANCQARLLRSLCPLVFKERKSGW